MKKYIFGLFASILFLSGCADEYDLYQDMENGSETVKVTFAVNIPAFKVATRQSLTDENTLNNLFLLVFDEKGNFIERVQATVSPSNATNGTFSATLPANKAKRIIHFIANYNWSGFDDEVAKQKDERENLRRMARGGQPDAALLLLQVPELSARRSEEWLPRLRYAYADALLELGRVEEARTWFERAAQADPDGTTDAEEMLAEMDGIVFDDAWGDDEADQRPTDAASPEVEPGPSV